MRKYRQSTKYRKRNSSGQNRIRKQDQQQYKIIRIVYKRYRRWSKHGFNVSAREIPRQVRGIENNKGQLNAVPGHDGNCHHTCLQQ